MKVDSFAYDLPSELIAQHPASDREQARLLVRTSNNVHHSSIRDLPEWLAPGSLIVLNDTKVVPARIVGTKAGSGGRAEVFLLRKVCDESPTCERWTALTRSSKGVRPGTRIVADSLTIEICDRTSETHATEGLVEVRVTTSDECTVQLARQRIGQVPLPPYIKRAPVEGDTERYQTVFARAEGAVAAPTAGLHLTHALLDRIKARGCEIDTCTLHVGLGTFAPVTVDDLDDHPMHAEWYEVSPSLVASVARARQRGAPVVAIGTTVVRALESAHDPEAPGHVRSRADETRLLIQPGYTFKVIDRLFTNFHVPRSTLLALVCAFSGTSEVLETYRLAVEARYRFFSYGDAMLLNRHAPSALPRPPSGPSSPLSP